MKLRLVELHEIDIAMEIMNEARRYLKQQGIDQWQKKYPDYDCIHQDIKYKKGFFIMDEQLVLGYVCIDYTGEPAYDQLQGEWQDNEKYVVVHRMAFTVDARGKGISDCAFRLIENMSRQKGIYSFRVDTDEDNVKMKHILAKNGFTYRGTICFDNSEKIAFDKRID